MLSTEEVLIVTIQNQDMETSSAASNQKQQKLSVSKKKERRRSSFATQRIKLTDEETTSQETLTQSSTGTSSSESGTVAVAEGGVIQEPESCQPETSHRSDSVSDSVTTCLQAKAKKYEKDIQRLQEECDDWEALLESSREHADAAQSQSLEDRLQESVTLSDLPSSLQSLVLGYMPTSLDDHDILKNVNEMARKVTFMLEDIAQTVQLIETVQTKAANTLEKHFAYLSQQSVQLTETPRTIIRQMPFTQPLDDQDVVKTL